MIRIWVIAGITLLAGCETEFERCMATELPRAEAAIGLTDEREAKTVLKDLQRYAEIELKFLPLMRN